MRRARRRSRPLAAAGGRSNCWRRCRGRARCATACPTKRISASPAAARAPGSRALKGGEAAFRAVMAEPLEELASIYRRTADLLHHQPQHRGRTRRDRHLARLQPGDGLRTRDRRRHQAHQGQHQGEGRAARTSSATRSSTIFPRATGRRARCRAGSAPPRARASTAPTCWARGSSRPTRSATSRT